jgi:Spy/CpxP family protein refolding chaperone
MKKQFLRLALGSAIALGSVMAAPLPQQDAPPPASGDHARGHQMDPKTQLEHMTKALNLTADQQNQILPILTDHQQQMVALRNDDSVAQQDRWEKMKAIREDMRTKVSAILTPDQKKKFEQMEQRQRDRRAEQRNQ